MTSTANAVGRVGLLGLGTVGSGVVKILNAHRAELEERAGCRLLLHRVADQDLARPREGLDLKRLPPGPSPPAPASRRLSPPWAAGPRPGASSSARSRRASTW